ncbi:GNAT family N-acetyltransferase [Anaerocolumna sp. AGMB13020]|uniref:GNAT family N-acetyltransferase n=1 Tax=Anaerocolumna sp. AGMB13020 TaxID=3081750 RepID=UPI0029529A5F|nr:GNAT family N-acetyltransferase [Anaerocolumna sp. AGMB13020]WOO35045.1 GNAT family N-acetyltransferase [Anaerocolumna sp. AGMB13020]
MKFKYRRIQDSDAHFLTQIFSNPEYELYFAENDTIEEDWIERFQYYKDIESNIIIDGAKPIGWIMYKLIDNVCDLYIVVLLDKERHKGYGKEIFSDLFEAYPCIKKIKLDVQQRNINACKFYQKLGFRIVSEERQPVRDSSEMYCNMELDI